MAWKSQLFTFTAFLFHPKVKATDADEGINGRVWYRIVKGKSRRPFVHRCICTGLWPAACTAPVRSPSFCTLQPTRNISPTPATNFSVRVNCRGDDVSRMDT